ncbi:MAG: glycosyltransferase family 39 protein [Anaerolineae bacterium]|nr:glycosyltransferase family 39 protein [Anaerolineae bacterium]
MLRYNPQFRPVPWPYPDNKNIVIHTDAEQFPYRSTVLAVHIVRAVSVLLGAGTVYCAHALARLLFPRESTLALGAMTVAALTPGFLFTSALVNNDNLVTFLASAALLLLAGFWKRGFSWSRSVLLGVVLGCAALSKVSGLLLWPFAGLVLVVLAWRSKRLALGLVTVALVFGLAALISGWWYVRNWVLYGDVTGLNLMLDIMGRRALGFGLGDALAEFEGIRRSFWALFGQYNVLAPAWLYWAYDLIVLLSLVGLFRYLARVIRQRDRANLVATGWLAAWALIVFLGVIRWTLTTTGSQGRLLYPGIAAISILLVRGWLELVPARCRFRQWVVTGIGAGFLVVAISVPSVLIVPAYAKPEHLSLEQVEEQISQQTDIRFEDHMVLLGYELEQQTVEAGAVEWITACWQGLGLLEEDYFVFVQLLDESDLIAAQQDTYHGLGSYPSSLWPQGAIICDRYPLRTRDTAPVPVQSTMSIGLYRRDGERLEVYGPGSEPLGESVRVPGPRIVARATEPRFSYEWGHEIALVDYELGCTAVLPGESLEITLQWRRLRQRVPDYAATVQVLDALGGKIGQGDVRFSAMDGPASTMEPDQFMVDQRAIEIAQNAQPGVYAIKVGVYDPSTVQNLALFHNGQVETGGGLLDLWGLRVLAGQP